VWYNARGIGRRGRMQLNWATIIIATGLTLTLVLSVGGAVAVAICTKDNQVAFTALCGLATTMSGSLIGWIARSPFNGNGNGQPPHP